MILTLIRRVAPPSPKLGEGIATCAQDLTNFKHFTHAFSRQGSATGEDGATRRMRVRYGFKK